MRCVAQGGICPKYNSAKPPENRISPHPRNEPPRRGSNPMIPLPRPPQSPSRGISISRRLLLSDSKSPLRYKVYFITGWWYLVSLQSITMLYCIILHLHDYTYRSNLIGSRVMGYDETRMFGERIIIIIICDYVY